MKNGRVPEKFWNKNFWERGAASVIAGRLIYLSPAKFASRRRGGGGIVALHAAGTSLGNAELHSVRRTSLSTLNPLLFILKHYVVRAAASQLSLLPTGFRFSPVRLFARLLLFPEIFSEKSFQGSLYVEVGELLFIL